MIYIVALIYSIDRYNESNKWIIRKIHLSLLSFELEMQVDGIYFSD